ncbi:SAM-dependent methyltransferase [Blastococcus sp. PRF04-17]|uniref:SAM-dependent methyltransferase n=1 Tax=Blastococcus sp. PRF04-17 TaxID=2933797 RepID=UPI001FF3BEA5|nr:SAM-dependent methyltransferase [Blastococcus sp. PRF04-17]UOY00973.1 SAM-dependent methyltransferase [Blastococcus sp. PRF04-17]
MTRNRATAAGRVVFVGAGPGDPGMLTARATDALAQAALVLVDPDVSPAVQAAVRDAHPALELETAIGEPAEVAKAAVAAAKTGAVVVRLVAGDPYTSDGAVKEALAVGRTSVPFDVVPGVATATAVPAYAGVALGSTAVTADLRSGVDLTALTGAVSAGGTLALQGSAEELPEAALRLIEGGCPAARPSWSPPGAPGRRRRASSPSSSPWRRRPPGWTRSPARWSRPSARPSTSAPGCRGGRAGHCSGGGCWCRAPRTRPAR